MVVQCDLVDVKQGPKGVGSIENASYNLLIGQTSASCDKGLLGM